MEVGYSLLLFHIQISDYWYHGFNDSDNKCTEYKLNYSTVYNREAML